jgi:ABC-type cobalt transport system substrate-binding protein
MDENPRPATPDYSGYYPRGPAPSPLEAEKLKALADGYFGLNWVFLANVLLAIAIRLVLVPLSEPGIALFALLGALGTLFLVVAFLTFPHNKKIAFGKGWDPSAALIASCLMGLNSALCCGIIGYVVMQQIASTEMKKYGIRTAFLGVRKKEVEARIRELSGPPHPVSGPPNSGPPGFQA